MSRPSPADCVGIWRRRKMRLSHQEWPGGRAPSPRFMRIPSRDLGGETNRAKNVAPDDRMQLSGLDGWGGKGVPPDETHHDQGETRGDSWHTCSKGHFVNSDPLCQNNTNHRVHWMREIVLLHIVSCKVVQAPSPRVCKARECAGITVSMHPPCGPLSKRIRDSIGIAEILEIFPEAYSEALQLVCWAYHRAAAGLPKHCAPKWLNRGSLSGSKLSTCGAGFVIYYISR